MCRCDACGKKFRPPIIYDEEENFLGFDYMCSSCKSKGRWEDTEESIRRRMFQRVTTLEENTSPVEKLFTYAQISEFND